MPKHRVLIVDDSVVIRKLLSEVIAQDSSLEVAGVAPNGKLALAKLPQLNPDLVTLDIEMPELDGLATLTELRKLYPSLPVIMFSSMTEHGAEATIEAMARGATDYVAKPAGGVANAAQGLQRVREELLPKIKTLCGGREATAAPAPPSPPVKTQRPKFLAPPRCDVVVIGSSTGGPQALSKVLREIPADFPLPILIVQHMPPVFTRHLADRLNQECAIQIVEAQGGELLEGGKALLAPGDFHLELVRRGNKVFALTSQHPPENSCRPAVDVLFRSAAAIYGSHCLAVVLTGMGQDGLRGAQSIVDGGGSVIAQDQATSVVWGMPRAVTEAGLARRVLPLRSIAPEIRQLAAVGRHAAAAVGAPR